MKSGEKNVAPPTPDAMATVAMRTPTGSMYQNSRLTTREERDGQAEQRVRSVGGAKTVQGEGASEDVSGAEDVRSRTVWIVE